MINWQFRLMIFLDINDVMLSYDLMIKTMSLGYHVNVHPVKLVFHQLKQFIQNENEIKLK